ncbi:DUF1552 domain-containing protein [Sorangium sp. So ce362]|uniref:DUF1552 domain-containing protein n=1 Tax=Sorangium sp. So ce362 TaxID=3133303 RepID=UPI003F62C16D
MNRRLFLRGICGAALAVPFLNSLVRSARAQEAPSPRRLVIFYTNNGCLTNRWFPTIENGAGSVTAASLETVQADGKPRTLAPLAPYAAKLLFPRGLAMPLNGLNNKVDGTVHFDPHDQGMGSKLTCAPLDPAGEHWALSHSLDHEIARRFNQGTNKIPLVLSVGNAFTNVKGIVSYSASSTPFAPVTNARTVYSSLTGLFASGSETEADHRVARGESIIDLVTHDLNALKARKMSGADRRKVDDWLALLRETEQRVLPSACTAEAAAALGVTDAALTAAGYPARGGGFGGNSETVYTLGSEMMIRLIALTMMCDNNRSIVLQWPGFVTFKWDGISHTHDHHGLSHRNGSAATGGQCVSGVLEQIHEIDRWYAGRYAKLVKTIDSIEEGGGTMLDNSAVMWLPELADGNAHNTNNLPIVIAGGAGGYLKQGVAVNLAGGNLAVGNSEASCAGGGEDENNSGNTGSSGGTVPLNKLYTTLINALGAGTPEWVPVDRFGVSDAVSAGFGGSAPSFTTDGAGNVIDGPGISNPGELDAIKA